MSSIDIDYPIADLNVFLMMRLIRNDQYTGVVEYITQTLKLYGLNALRADDRTYKDQLWDNVRAYMDSCRYGIAIFEDIDKREFNPNVSIELGYMLGTKPPLSILILKEGRLESLPTDILGHLYKEFDAFHIQETIEPAVRQWLRDIGIAKSAGERRLIYVSHGGTCRCVMAKIATDQALKGRKLKMRLSIQNMALTYGAHAASSGARNAVGKIYGKNLAASHRSVPNAPGFLQEGDLIIAMDNSIKACPAHGPGSRHHRQVCQARPGAAELWSSPAAADRRYAGRGLFAQRGKTSRASLATWSSGRVSCRFKSACLEISHKRVFSDNHPDRRRQPSWPAVPAGRVAFNEEHGRVLAAAGR